jgi:hypothetical protein
MQLKPTYIKHIFSITELFLCPDTSKSIIEDSTIIKYLGSLTLTINNRSATTAVFLGTGFFCP